MTESTGKNCMECKYCIEFEYGYSNYTVEGQEVDCLLKLNHNLPKDRWYGQEPVLRFANECKRFTKGDSVSVDVEQDKGHLENYSDDEEIKTLLKQYDAQ